METKEPGRKREKMGAANGGRRRLGKTPVVAIAGPRGPSEGRRGPQASASSTRSNLERDRKRGGGKEKKGGEGGGEATDQLATGRRK